VARTFSRRVPLARLIQVETDVRGYLAAVLLAALAAAGEKAYLPSSLQYETITDEDFKKKLLDFSVKNYPTYGVLENLRVDTKS
jgi:hypothetical protein